MRKRQALLIELATYRELPPRRQQELLKVPGCEEMLDAYQKQDKLLAALPRPKVPARAIVRILAATTMASDNVARPALVWQRWALPALVGVLLLAMLGGTGYVAAQSLPGDGLYGIKRAAEQTRLALTMREESRSAYEERLAERRRAEILALLGQGRNGVQVTFTGMLQQGPDGAWTATGVPVVLPSDAQLAAGSVVHIQGWTEDGRVKVSLATLRSTPTPTISPDRAGAPQASPTGALSARTPQATPTNSVTGAGEPQYRQGSPATAWPTAKATTRVETPTGAASRTQAKPTVTQHPAGPTATMVAKRTSSPATPAPTHGAAPQATSEQKGDPHPSPSGSGAGQGQPSGTSSGAGSSGNKGGKP